MSQLRIMNRPRLIAAATALSAVGFLTASPPAQAHPMLPLAPACDQYRFNGNFSLKQSNGDMVVFSSIGQQASGNATATGGINGPLHGVVTGGIKGDKLDFTMVWNENAPGTTAPSQGDYTGYVSADGFAHGDTSQHNVPFGDTPGGSAHWDSTVPLVCVTPAAPAPAPPPAPVSHQPVPPLAPTPAPSVATVTSDVDVYDNPGGGGNIIGTLRANQQVDIVGGCQKNDWCHVVGPAVPSGRGWVFGALQF
jgi:hypothetical protein